EQSGRRGGGRVAPQLGAEDVREMAGGPEGDGAGTLERPGLEVVQAPEHRGAAVGFLQVPGERIPALATTRESGADLLGLRSGAHVGVEHGGAGGAVLALEDEVRIWPVRHSAATSISGGSARAIAERAARTQSAGACSAPPPGRWRVGYSALVLTIVRPPRSISAAFAEVVARSRQSRPIMRAGYAREVWARRRCRDADA